MLLDGGLNNDNLSVSSEVNEGGISDTLTGGEGDDDFEITMNISERADATAQDSLVTVTDYNPEEDRIQISIDAPPPEASCLTGLSL